MASRSGIDDARRSGGWKAPIRFLPSGWLTPTLPPIALSTCASSVVGTCTTADAAQEGRRREAGDVADDAAADGDDRRSRGRRRRGSARRRCGRPSPAACAARRRGSGSAPRALACSNVGAVQPPDRRARHDEAPRAERRARRAARRGARASRGRCRSGTGARRSGDDGTGVRQAVMTLGVAAIVGCGCRAGAGDRHDADGSDNRITARVELRHATSSSSAAASPALRAAAELAPVGPRPDPHQGGAARGQHRLRAGRHRRSRRRRTIRRRSTPPTRSPPATGCATSARCACSSTTARGTCAS